LCFQSDLDTKTNLGEYFREEEEGVSLENDYDDLESDESGPLRLKRSIDGIGEGKVGTTFSERGTTPRRSRSTRP
jgi:hypothetical protein